MSWLKVDDGFAAHPKVAALNDREFRVWVRLLCYLSRYRSETGLLTEGAYSEVPGLSPKLAGGKLVEIGLIDEDEDGGFYVHDWEKYLPKRDGTAAQRQARHRDRNAVTEGVTNAVTNAVSNAVTEGVTNGDTTASSRARTHVRSRPVPSPKTSSRAVELQDSRADADDPDLFEGEEPTALDIEYLQNLDLTRPMP